MTTVSVVICAYTEERLEALRAAVTSVQNQSTAPFELVLVIDHNRGLFDLIKETLPSVRVVENCHATGLAGARNTAIEQTSGEVIAFLDDDAVAAPGWLEALSTHYASPHVLGVGGTIEPAWVTGRPTWFPGEFDWVVGCTYRGGPTETSPVRNLIGANMSIRRTVFEGVGGFTDGMGRVGVRPLGCEETELCIRAGTRWPDGTFVFEPSARVNHTVPSARCAPSYFLARCYAEGLSKASVARLSGTRRALASERTYAARALPLAVGRGVVDAIFRRNAGGALRALAVVIGFAATVAGYVRGTLQRSPVELRPFQLAEPAPLVLIEKGSAARV